MLLRKHGMMELTLQRRSLSLSIHKKAIIKGLSLCIFIMGKSTSGSKTHGFASKGKAVLDIMAIGM